MKKFILSVVASVVLSLPTIAFEHSNLKKVEDSELENIYAQGFITNYQVVGNNINNMNNVVTYNITEQFPQLQSVASSIFITGASQSNAFVPVNAVNSAVNVPINIVVIMNSNVIGGVNINNALEAITRIPSP